MPKERVRLCGNKVDAVQHQYQCRRPTQQSPPQQPSETSYNTSDDVMSSELTCDILLNTTSDTSSVTSSPHAAVASGADLATDNRTNLIVNYLPQSMCQEDLKTLFGSIGPLDSCKLVRDKLTGYSLGYGFVKYRCTETAQKAIQTLNGLKIQNKILKVSLARPSCDNIKGANLYVGGLPRHMTNHDLIQLFADCGQIITARILSDPNTGLTKGVGFIRFNLKSEAEAAIRLRSGTVPPGATEPITVKFANQPTVNKATVSTPSSVPTLIGTVQSGAVVSAHNSPLATGIRFEHIVPTHSNSAVGPLSGATALLGATGACGGGGPFTLCLSNLPEDANDSFVWQLLQPFANVQSIHIVREPSTNRSKGVALVTVLSYDESMHAVLRLNGQPIGSGNVLQVTLLNGPQLHGGGGGPVGSAGALQVLAQGPAAGLVVHRTPSVHGFMSPTLFNQDSSIYPTVYQPPYQGLTAGHLATATYGLVQLPIM